MLNKHTHCVLAVNTQAYTTVCLLLTCKHIFISVLAVNKHAYTVDIVAYTCILSDNNHMHGVCLLLTIKTTIQTLLSITFDLQCDKSLYDFCLHTRRHTWFLLKHTELMLACTNHPENSLCLLWCVTDMWIISLQWTRSHFNPNKNYQVFVRKNSSRYEIGNTASSHSCATVDLNIGLHYWNVQTVQPLTTALIMSFFGRYPLFQSSAFFGILLWFEKNFTSTRGLLHESSSKHFSRFDNSTNKTNRHWLQPNIKSSNKNLHVKKIVMI